MTTIIESFVGNYLLNKVVASLEDGMVKTIGVKEEFKKLERRIRRIGPYLTDAERRRFTDEPVNKWLNELKDVMYDVDDVIDLGRYNNKWSPTGNPSFTPNSQTCFHWASCFRLSPLRHEVSQKIKNLNARLDEILKDMANLNLKNIQAEPGEFKRVDGCAITPVIGLDVISKEIEEGAKKLIKLATMDNKQKVNLVAISGIGGIGKTTMAQRIFNNQIIQNRYVIKIWLHVSQSYSPAHLIREAIKNAGGDPGEAKTESELLPILASAISEKSFFLVLDDMWSADLWVNLLQDPLKANATWGFVLVTTRDQTVAMQMGAKHIHQAPILSTKSGWELLCKGAYLSDTMDIEELKEVGVEIVKKCGGLPIAIKTISGMLAAKSKTRKEWENVLNSNTWTISGLPIEIDRALYLSYEDLSPQLKQCFLYCCLYPSNQRLYYRDIIQDWIAEGFIEERENQLIEDSAEECYYELIRRHLLETEPLFPDQSRCRMHDLLRYLAKHLTAGESFSGDQVLLNAANISRLRRLFITETNDSISIPGPATQQLKLRNFQISKCLPEIESNLFRRLRYLRVLNINEQGLLTVPESLGQLIHLRKLDLGRTSISNLPQSIGSLTNLLFLNLAGCKFLRTLPSGVTRLYNLRHLKLRDTPLISVPENLGELQKLTEIWDFQVVGDGKHDEDQSGWDLQELEELSQLRRIWISKLERARNVSVVLANKIHLKELVLHFSKPLERVTDYLENSEEENNKETLEKLYPPPCLENLRIENYRGKVLPIWMSSLKDLLPNLQYLHLIGWSCCTELPPLGLLPNLKHMKVQGASSIVRISSELLGVSAWDVPNLPVAFPKLEYLIFEDMLNWEEWVLPSYEGKKYLSWQLMPHIKVLSIEKCPKLGALPEALQQLTTIEALLVRVSGSIKSIEGFPFECQNLLVEHNQCLETLSNLPGVKKLNIFHMYNLRHVSKLDSVDYIKLVNYKMKCLPKWLVILLKERKECKEFKLHLELLCSTALLQRCIKDGPDWPIIKNFSSVSVYNKERTATLEYTREPESYYASL